MGLAVLANDQHVGLFLTPRQRSLGAVDFDEQVVFATVADLTGRDGTESPVLISNYRGAVIIELATRLEGLQMAADFRWQQAGHVASKVSHLRWFVRCSSSS